MTRAAAAERAAMLIARPATGIAARPARRVTALGAADATVAIAEEIAVALLYNGVSYAVMMASPTELEAFGLGFSLSEGILDHPGELRGVEIRPGRLGIELRMSIDPRRLPRLKERQRNMAGCTGCGLCGVESLRQARRLLPRVPKGPHISPAAIRRALDELPGFQPLNREAGAVHAAAWADCSGEIIASAEDIGRHNALDKLIGLLAASGGPRPEGFLVLTSRCSYELVAKAAMVGIAMLVAISAPTTVAIETADAAGMTIIALARDDAMTLYAGPGRILPGAYTRS